MIRCSACRYDDALRIFPLIAEINFVKRDVGILSVFFYEAWAKRVRKRFWLLVYLFEHEVRVAAFFRRRDIPVNVVRLFNDFLSVFGEQVYMVFIKNGNFFLVKEIHVARVFKHGGNVARNKVLCLSKPYNERAFLSRGNQPVRVILADNAERVASIKLVKSLQNSREDVWRLLVIVVHKMRYNLCVSLAPENNALRLKPSLKLHVVLDDAVMHHGNRAAYVRLRMRVYIARLSVCRPARVTNPERAFYHLVRDFFFQKFECAFRLAHDYVFSAENRDSRAVIAPVLQLFERAHKNRCRVLMPDISYNSTHFLPPRPLNPEKLHVKNLCD